MRRVVAPIVVLIALAVGVAWLMRSAAGPPPPSAPPSPPATAPDAATLSAGDAPATANQAPAAEASRALIHDADTTAFVVRGQALRAMNTPYPGARLDAQCFVGGATDGTPDLRAELTCDGDGRFEWRLPAPTTVLCLSFSSALPRHVGWPNKVVVARGDPAPQDLEVYVAPLDRVATGRVTDTEGRPIAGAFVKTSVERVACAADGEYRVEFSTSFAASVVAGAPGCLSERRVFGESTDADARVDFRLRPGLRVAGVVVDEQAAPVAGATVRSFFMLAGTATTDASGGFELTDLDPDRERHSVFARAPGYVEAKTDVISKAVPPELKLVLRRGARVEGRVFAPDGSPVGGAEIYLGFSSSAYDRLDAVSKDDGTFVFPAVGAGEHRMVTTRRGHAPDQRQLQVPKDASVVTAEVRMQAAHFLAGRASDDAAQPLAGVRVAVMVPSTRQRGMSGRGEYIEVEATTTADGSFRLEGLPAGRVILEFYSRSHVRKLLQDVEVDRSEVEVALQRAATIAGRVVDAVSGEPVTTFKIRFVTAKLAPGERGGGGYAATWVREGRSFVDARGRWRAEGEEMEPGTIWGVEAIAAGYAPARNTHVVAALAPDPDACVLALPRGGTVSGRVLGRNTGAPIAGATLTWFADEVELQRAAYEPYGLLRARTDAAGAFELSDLPPGDTKLAVEATGMPRHVEGPFALASGQRVQRTILLGDGARIRGQVVNAAGEPVADARLMLHPRSDRSLQTATGESRAEGSFAFPGLAAGEYDLSGYALSDGVSTCYARRLTVEVDQDLELRLAPEGSASVRGTIGGEGPVPDGVSLLLLPSGEASATRTALRGVAHGNAFELRGAPAGEYLLHASAPDGRMGSTKVTLREGTSIEAAVTLAKRR